MLVRYPKQPLPWIRQPPRGRAVGLDGELLELLQAANAVLGGSTAGSSKTGRRGNLSQRQRRQ